MTRRNIKLTVEDLRQFLWLTVDYVNAEDSDEKEIMRKMRGWAEGELERREKSGKAGGRPKKSTTN